MHDAVVNILILREVKPANRKTFEETVRRWIPEAVRFPGHLGVFMLTPPPGLDEYGALLRFESDEAWQEFSAWEPYRVFLDEIRPLLAKDPRIELMHGLEAWFRSTNAPHPPRWKMALLTYLGVCAMVWPSSKLVTLLIAPAPFIAKYLLVNAMVVAGLTWFIMPVLVRIGRRWLGRKRVQS